jgi:hypothetical protein
MLRAKGGGRGPRPSERGLAERLPDPRQPCDNARAVDPIRRRGDGRRQDHRLSADERPAYYDPRAAGILGRGRPDRAADRTGASAESLARRSEDVKTHSTMVVEEVLRAEARKCGREGMTFLVTHGLGPGPRFLSNAAAKGVRVIAQRSFPEGPHPPIRERNPQALAKWRQDRSARNAKSASK